MLESRIQDMVELGVEAFKPSSNFKGNKRQKTINMSCIVFIGREFGLKPEYKTARNLFLDTFRCQDQDFNHINYLNNVISIVAHQNKLYLRQYSISIDCLDNFETRLELDEVGPSIDFTMQRYQEATNPLFAQARQELRQSEHIKMSEMIHKKVFGRHGSLYITTQDLYSVSQIMTKG